jgi:hypothetical protein
MPRGGMVELTPSRGSKLTLILLEPPDRTLGVGGFQSSERALRRAAKWYKGIPDDTLSLNCLLDVDAIGGPSIERRLEVLRDMGLAGSEDEPPTITLDGDVWANDKAISWVISDGGLALGARDYQSDGTLRQQQVTVTLERYTALSEIEAIRVTRTRKAGRSRRSRTVATRANDTLRAVALRELGDGNRWKDLKSWNKKLLRGVDPDARLRTSTRLTVR